MEVCYWALLFMPLVPLHHLLNVFVQLANKRGFKQTNKKCAFVAAVTLLKCRCLATIRVTHIITSVETSKWLPSKKKSAATATNIVLASKWPNLLITEERCSALFYMSMYTFIYNLLNVLVQIANKMGFKRKCRELWEGFKIMYHNMRTKFHTYWLKQTDRMVIT
jgi:hypothetical protein